MIEVGHILTLDGEDYCVCDIKKYGEHDFCYTLRGEKENSKIDFLKLVKQKMELSKKNKFSRIN